MRNFILTIMTISTLVACSVDSTDPNRHSFDVSENELRDDCVSFRDGEHNHGPHRIKTNRSSDLPIAMIPDDGFDCDPDDPQWGCPGMPCAHGFCDQGAVCVGVQVDSNGITVDPGVCCIDDDCDSE